MLNPPSENSPAMAMTDLVQNFVESFLELTPGVPANQRNLKTLLEKVKDEEWCAMSDEMKAVISPDGQEVEPGLYVWLDGAKVEWVVPNLVDVVLREPVTHSTRPRLTSKSFPATEDGLLQAIVFLKRSIHKYRTEGTCEACEPLTKRLKADGMPKCEDCMLSAAIGI